MEIIVILYRANETFFNIKPCIVSFSVASLLNHSNKEEVVPHKYEKNNRVYLILLFFCFRLGTYL